MCYLKQQSYSLVQQAFVENIDCVFSKELLLSPSDGTGVKPRHSSCYLPDALIQVVFCRQYIQQGNLSYTDLQSALFESLSAFNSEILSTAGSVA